MHRITRSRLLAAALLLVTASAAGCKDDDEANTQAGKQAPAATPALEATAANAAVPETLAGKVAFTVGTGDEDRLAVLLPDGWEESGAIPGLYRPGEDLGLGFMTSYSVGTSCDGACSPKDWTAAAGKTEFAQFETDSFTVVSDEPLEGGGRILVARNDDRAFVAAARWKDGASRYAYCRASLDGRATDALDAFVQACRDLQVRTW